MRIELEQLISLGRNVAPPFEIALADGDCAVTEIHRLLPGRRLAGRGSYRGRQAFVKLFFGKGANRACKREKRGVAILRESGVHTPKLLLGTTTATPGGYVLIFDYLRAAQPLTSSALASNATRRVIGALSRMSHQPPAVDAAASPKLGRDPCKGLGAQLSTLETHSSPPGQAGRYLDAPAKKVGEICGLDDCATAPRAIAPNGPRQGSGVAPSRAYAMDKTPRATQPGESTDQDGKDAINTMLAVAALARLHKHGAYHRDTNLDNFLVGEGRLYLVDGAAIGRKGPPLGERTSLRALAEFLAEFPPVNDHRLPELLARYVRERAWPVRRRRFNTGGPIPQVAVGDTNRGNASGEKVTAGAKPRGAGSGRIARLRIELAAARRRRVRRFLAKTERNCTEFHCEPGWRKTCLAKRGNWNAALAEFARNPHAALANSEIIKNGRSATVFRLKLANEMVVVKRYNLKTTSHRVRRWFKHRARIAWRNGHRLAFLGIPCAEPIALIERRWGPLRAESWLVMPDCGSQDIQTEVEARGWSDLLLNNVIELFQGLQTAGLYHGDTKASNFLIHNGEVRLIDYDSLREFPGTKLDIARFLENFAGEARAHATRRLAKLN